MKRLITPTSWGILARHGNLERGEVAGFALREATLDSTQRPERRANGEESEARH